LQDTSTLLGMLMSLREEMGAERAARLELEKVVHNEKAARLELEKVVHNEKEKNKELLAEQETMKNQIAAEKGERLDQLGEVENRAVELEDWVSTQVRPFFPCLVLNDG
jgi:hypothetical protein